MSSDEYINIKLPSKRIYWGGSGDGIELFPDMNLEKNRKLIDDMAKFASKLEWEY